MAGGIKGPPRRIIWIVSISLITGLLVLLSANSLLKEVLPLRISPDSGTVESSDHRPPPHPLPADLLLALRTPNDFQMRHRIRDIPGSVQLAFARAAHLDAFSMAEPGPRWQATDVVLWPQLPRRRLAEVAFAESFCLVFYEHGGFGESNNVAAFRLSASGVEAVGHAYLDSGIADPAALHRAIAGGKALTLDAAFF